MANLSKGKSNNVHNDEKSVLYKAISSFIGKPVGVKLLSKREAIDTIGFLLRSNGAGSEHEVTCPIHFWNNIGTKKKNY